MVFIVSINFHQELVRETSFFPHFVLSPTPGPIPYLSLFGLQDGSDRLQKYCQPPRHLCRQTTVIFNPDRFSRGRLSTKLTLMDIPSAGSEELILRLEAVSQRNATYFKLTEVHHTVRASPNRCLLHKKYESKKNLHLSSARFRAIPHAEQVESNL